MGYQSAWPGTSLTCSAKSVIRRMTRRLRNPRRCLLLPSLNCVPGLNCASGLSRIRAICLNHPAAWQLIGRPAAAQGLDQRYAGGQPVLQNRDGTALALELGRLGDDDLGVGDGAGLVFVDGKPRRLLRGFHGLLLDSCFLLK